MPVASHPRSAVETSKGSEQYGRKPRLPSKLPSVHRPGALWRAKDYA